jgi:exonuclease SbcC
MEKTITSIAIRSALQMVSVLSKPNFLIFDEGFGTLDEDSIEPVSKLLTKLKDGFSFVLVISHVNLIKESFDMTIEVQKDKNNYSYVGGTQ